MNKHPEEHPMTASGVRRASFALCGFVLSVSLSAHAAEPTPCVASGAQDRALASESYRIPSEMPGVELYMRNKRPNGVDLFPPERIVLYVHGATYPSETAFDLPLGGLKLGCPLDDPLQSRPIDAGGSGDAFVHATPAEASGRPGF